MQIYGPAHVHGPQAANAPHAQRGAQPPRSEGVRSMGDQLEISDAARLASQLAEVPDIRQDRVDSIKAAIADGSYETEEKLSLALDRLLDEMA